MKLHSLTQNLDTYKTPRIFFTKEHNDLFITAHIEQLNLLMILTHLLMGVGVFASLFKPSLRKVFNSIMSASWAMASALVGDSD